MKYTMPSDDLKLSPTIDPESHDFSSPSFSPPKCFLSMMGGIAMGCYIRDNNLSFLAFDLINLLVMISQ